MDTLEVLIDAMSSDKRAKYAVISKTHARSMDLMRKFADLLNRNGIFFTVNRTGTIRTKSGSILFAADREQLEGQYFAAIIFDSYEDPRGYEKFIKSTAVFRGAMKGQNE